MSAIKTLIHLHTDYSYDSDISLDVLARYLERNRFGCIAVTDHDTIEGARRLADLTDVKVIVGEEVTTRDGHLIGLFLKERVRPGLSARETALAIKEQGGLVFVPHPFNRLFGCGLRETVWSILDLVDAVEINNAQNLFPLSDFSAARFARKTGLTPFVGADSHRELSLAPCHQIMPDFGGPAEFLTALRSATLVTGRHSLDYFARMSAQLLRYFCNRSRHSTRFFPRAAIDRSVTPGR